MGYGEQSVVNHAEWVTCGEAISTVPRRAGWAQWSAYPGSSWAAYLCEKNYGNLVVTYDLVIRVPAAPGQARSGVATLGGPGLGGGCPGGALGASDAAARPPRVGRSGRNLLLISVAGQRTRGGPLDERQWSPSRVTQLGDRGCPHDTGHHRDDRWGGSAGCPFCAGRSVPTVGGRWGSARPPEWLPLRAGAGPSGPPAKPAESRKATRMAGPAPGVPGSVRAVPGGTPGATIAGCDPPGREGCGRAGLGSGWWLGPAEGPTGRAEILARLGHPGRHAAFGELSVGARVVGLLRPDLAVHLEYPVIVLEDVVHDGTGE